MSRWKTSSTARRPKQSNSSDTMEDLVLTSEDDNMHLSFLDDMLGSTNNRNTVYASGGKFSSATRNDGHKYGESDPCDIDDILDLVNSEKDRTSSSSATGENNPLYTTNHSSSRSRPGSSSSSSLKKYGESSSGNSRTGSKNGTGSTSNSRSGRNSRGESIGKDIPSKKLAMEEDALDKVLLPPLDIHPATFEQAPFFGAILNTERDDDTMSQITSSVTSQSFYDSTADGSRSSYPWLRSKSQRASTSSPKLSAYSHAESSFADTLDEIADMIGPARVGGSSSRSPLTPRQNRQIPSGDDPLFRSSQQKKQTQDLPLYSPKSDTYRSKGEESYRNSAASIRRNTQRRSSVTHWTSMLEPFLSQFRLLLRYLATKVVPNKWIQKNRKAKEEQEGSGEQEKDYFGVLMRGKGGTDDKPRSRQRERVFSSLFKYIGFFLSMTALLLMSRLALMHAKSLRPYGRVTKLLKHSEQEQVHGGMSNRSRRKNVRGGMAHHGEKVITKQYNIPHEDRLSNREHIGLELPEHFDHLSDVLELPVKKGVDIPFFWHIPRTGGGTVNDIFGECLSHTLATDAGGRGNGGQENILQIIQHPTLKYLNVDTSTQEGIARAKRLDLAGSEIVDIIVSTLLHQATTLFSSTNQGRMFTMFRHPVDRAVSLFHYVQDTQWRQRQSFKKELSDLTIEEYFKSGLAENNWMTRFLINELTKGELTKQDVNLAKEILRRKCLIGILNEKGESFARFERYFGFPVKSETAKECHEKKLQWAWPSKHRHDEVEEGTAVWDLIMSHNQWDMELYEYVQTLFQEQAIIFQ